MHLDSGVRREGPWASPSEPSRLGGDVFKEEPCRVGHRRHMGMREVGALPQGC